jgi:hypothetical protein
MFVAPPLPTILKVEGLIPQPEKESSKRQEYRECRWQGKYSEKGKEAIHGKYRPAVTLPMEGLHGIGRGSRGEEGWIIRV